MNRKTLLTIAMLASMAFIAHAQNLVANPGFETGDFTGWTQGGNAGFTLVDGAAAHSGNFGAQMGPVGSDGFFSQTLPTVVGQLYTVDFWLSNARNGGTLNDLRLLLLV